MHPYSKRNNFLNSQTNPSKRSREMNSANQLYPRQKEPTAKQTRNIIAVAVAECVKLCMDRH